MKQILLILTFALSITSCKKFWEPKKPDTSLTASFFLKDANQVSRPLLANYYLIKPEYQSDLATAQTVKDNCPKHSYYGFSGTQTKHSQDALPGDYILVVQIVPKEENRGSWFRYSYKKIHIEKGDKLNESMVFRYGGVESAYEPWNDK